MEKEICRLLHTSLVGRNLICLDEVDSTNTYAKKLALDGAPDGTVVIADCQTAGRGRRERLFQSPRGSGLYLTALLRPGLPAERLIPATAMAGVAVCAAVEQTCGIRPGLKWPNDPVLGRRKLGGILTELTGDLALVIGIGINLSPAALSPDVAAIATCLERELGQAVSRPVLAAALIEELERLSDALRAGALEPYRAAFRRDCVNLGNPVQILSGDTRETVQALDIDEMFGLIIRDAQGQLRTVRSGEVSVRGLYGYVE